MKQGQRLWTREELILAINLYCKLPFGKMHKLTPEIVELAKIIGRSPSSVALKLGNFASFDPSLQARGVKGASNSSKLDREIWDEFYSSWGYMPFKSEEILANAASRPIDSILNGTDEQDLPKGNTRDAVVKIRVNQRFFRQMILASYSNRCCITGINQPELLVAGHIVPWSVDVENRLNPRNGLAINALHDKAFEEGLITITPDYRIKISSILKRREGDSLLEDYFLRYEGRSVMLPSKFLPDEKFLEYHNKNRFKP